MFDGPQFGCRLAVMGGLESLLFICWLSPQCSRAVLVGGPCCRTCRFRKSEVENLKLKEEYRRLKEKYDTLQKAVVHQNFELRRGISEVLGQTA